MKNFITSVFLYFLLSGSSFALIIHPIISNESREMKRSQWMRLNRNDRSICSVNLTPPWLGPRSSDSISSGKSHSKPLKTSSI